jgi:hypothetical protein
MAAKAKAIDWAAVEMLYRAGIRSLKSIGAECGISDAGIIKRAKQEGWERDLSERIRLKTAAKVSAAMVSGKVSAAKKATEVQVVEAAASAQTLIIISQQKDIAEARAIVQMLFKELRSAMKKLDLPAKSMVAHRLSGALATLIEKERQAAGIDKDDRGHKSYPEWLEEQAA